MRNFPHQDELHLQAAAGWLGLGDWREANEELGNISAHLRSHPDVLKARIKIYAEAKKWDSVVELADALTQTAPDSNFGPLHSAFARQKLRRFAEARDHLITIADQFPNDWRVQYTLASLSCKLGERDAAMQWLEKAIDNAGPQDIRLHALKDPDLEAVWCDIADI